MTRWMLLSVLLLAALQRPASLGAVLLARNLPPPDAADLDRPITSHATLDDERGFAIAYYGVEPDGALHELRVRTYDRATRTWRKWTRAQPIGPVMGLQRGGRFLLVTGRSSPSASPLLVLTDTDTLDLKRELDGWPKLALPDGRIVFVRSMRHFAPAHAAALALYDPSTDRETAVYPPAGVKNERGAERIAGTDLWMDRSIDAVTLRPGGTIEVSVVERRIRLDRDQKGTFSGAEQRALVICAIDTAPPACKRQAANR